jgi:glycosyltransferase involved in cell wall biosynthesis
MHAARAHSLGSVSVVIPTYNCAALLPRAIRSAYAQRLPAREVIVVDDGSTDGTAAVLRGLAPSLPDNFVYRSKPNGGEASGRNRGVSLATGDFIAFLDQDDVWLPDKLDEQLGLFRRDPSLALTFTAYHRDSPAGRTLVDVRTWDSRPEAVLRRLFQGCCITPSTVVVRRDVLARVGPFDESLWLGCDWDMWLRIAASGHHIGYLPEPLTDYLWHDTNMSRDLKKIAAAAEVIFGRLFASGTLPAAVQRLEKRCLARWRMIHACYCLETGGAAEARRHLWRAVGTRPASVRPGWVALYARSLLVSLRGLWGRSRAGAGGRQ